MKAKYFQMSLHNNSKFSQLTLSNTQCLKSAVSNCQQENTQVVRIWSFNPPNFDLLKLKLNKTPFWTNRNNTAQAEIIKVSTKVSQLHLYLKNVSRISKVIIWFKNTASPLMKVLRGPTLSVSASTSKNNHKSLSSMITKMIQFNHLKILTLKLEISSSSKTAC